MMIENLINQSAAKPVYSELASRSVSQEMSPQSGSIHSARRKFTAEAALQPLPLLPKAASDLQIQSDLNQLNSGVSGALDRLLKDIGGNLSAYRTSDGLWSLIDLCARQKTPFTTAATVLLNRGFSFQNTSPRYQWEENDGYCGETSLISAGLANGEYISQYDARALATGSQQDEVLLGDGSDLALAKAMHLQAEEYADTGNVNDFISWMQGQLAKGNQVAIGIYTNENTFYDKTDPNAGKEYDHIVIVTGIKDGKITFLDHGLYGDGPSDSPYEFTYPITDFLGSRQQANTPFDDPGPSIPRSIYTLPNDQTNYGIAIQGVKGADETLPVHLFTNPNSEPNEITDQSDARPSSTPVTLTGCITGLTPGKEYKIYVYDQLSKVPDGDFNKNASQAAHCITFTATGASYVFTNQIQSSDQIAYRVVPS